MRPEQAGADTLRAARLGIVTAQTELRDLRRLIAERKYREGQPRAPAGAPGAGQWVLDRNKPEPQTKPKPRAAGRAGALLAILAAIDRWLRPQEIAAYEIGIDPENPPQLKVMAPLTEDELRQICPRLDEVKSRTDQAAREAAIAFDQTLEPQRYGTAVHRLLKAGIDVLKDPNFQAEQSFYKSALAAKEGMDAGETVPYGAKDTVRIDVFELRSDNAVCVYDIKTGKSDLSVPRMLEIATAVHNLYGARHRIIITRVAPRR